MKIILVSYAKFAKAVTQEQQHIMIFRYFNNVKFEYELQSIGRAFLQWLRYCYDMLFPSSRYQTIKIYLLCNCKSIKWLTSVCIRRVKEK